MHKISFISTVHKEIGQCNSSELHKIIEELSPEVIFLEALNDTYSEYEKVNFLQFQVYHGKLEIAAIQKYSHNASFKYIPVLDNPMSEAFDKKYNQLSTYVEFQKLVDNFNSQASEYGFKFLNSTKSIRLQEEMRILENSLLNDEQLDELISKDIDTYENSMLYNIYSYCKDNQFDSAIFMCGVAHRKSIIEKIEKYNIHEEINLNWIVLEN